MQSKIAFFLLFVSFFSCNYFKKDKSNILAEVGDQVLLVEEVKDALGDNINLSDLNVKSFVNNWVREEVVLQNSERLLSPSEKDFSQELQLYKNSLIRFAYESKYIKEKIDTSVSQKQIDDYYKNNFSNFELKENIVKVRIVKTPIKFAQKEKCKKLVVYKSIEDQFVFEKWVKKNRLQFINYDSSWVSLEGIMAIVPIKANNAESILKKSDCVEIIDGDFVWILYFLDYTLKDNISPIEAVEGKIKSILVNKRKLTTIKEMEKLMYEKAVKEGDVKLYLN